MGKEGKDSKQKSPRDIRRAIDQEENQAIPLRVATRMGAYVEDTLPGLEQKIDELKKQEKRANQKRNARNRKRTQSRTRTKKK